MFRHLTVEERGTVALLRIDRPPVNAMDLELLAEGRAVLDELAEAEPGAVVVTGNERAFSAGVDLKLAPTLDAAGQREMVAGINSLFAGWYGFSRPVVCAVNGHAIAGGLILALCGDFRVGVQDAQYGLTELRAGIPYPAVALAVVRSELAPAAARALVLRADLVDGERALDLGILDEVVEPQHLLDRALELAGELAELPRTTYGVVKTQLRGEAVARMEAIVAGGEDPLDAGWIEPGETAEAASGLLRR